MQNVSYDILGNIALVKFPRNIKSEEKKRYAKKVMTENRAIKTILEKTGKFSGRLRKQKTKYILGENTKEVLYKENGCVFRFNLDSSYFSPRLSNERKEIAEKIKKNDVVLVMFAGVAPFPIVIAKNSQAKRVYSNEINREANKYAKLNIELNKIKDKVRLVPGNIKKIAVKLSLQQTLDLCSLQNRSYINKLLIVNQKNQASDNERAIPSKFDVIVMPRPQLKESFLKEAFSLSKSGRRGTRIYYYDFCREEEIDSIAEKVKKEAGKYKKKIKILRIKKAGEIGPYKIRIRVDFIVG